MERNELLQLQQFSEKKEWIQSQLNSLRSNIIPKSDEIEFQVTKLELEEFWIDQEDLESRVDGMIDDQGELGRLKSFAREASKLNLSSEDTNLIELALSTIFGCDRLLLKLRVRRNELSLLTCRLLWEESVLLIRGDYNSILTDLPKFLFKARWTLPSTPFHSASSDITSSKTNSKQTLVLQKETLSLELATQKSKIHLLLKVSLMNSGKFLDKWIEESSKPLLDYFLDLQDELEELIGGMTGLGVFLEELGRQFKGTEEIFSDEMKLEEELKQFRLEFIKVGEIPLESLEISQIEALELRLVELTSIFESITLAINNLPLPNHLLVPNQSDHNTELVRILLSELNQLGLEKLEIDLNKLKLVKEFQLSLMEYQQESSLVMNRMNDSMKDESVLLDELELGVVDVTRLTKVGQAYALQVSPLLVQPKNNKNELRLMRNGLLKLLELLKESLNKLNEFIIITQFELGLSLKLKELNEFENLFTSQIQSQLFFNHNPPIAIPILLPDYEPLNQSTLELLSSNVTSKKIIIQSNSLKIILESIQHLQSISSKVQDQTAAVNVFLESQAEISQQISKIHSTLRSNPISLQLLNYLKSETQQLKLRQATQTTTIHLEIKFLHSSTHCIINLQQNDELIKLEINEVILRNDNLINSLQDEIIEAKKLEEKRLEEERIELERLKAIRLEEERIEIARIETLRIETERIEAARLEAIRVEKQRIEEARLEAIRLEEERIELERLEILRIENERIEMARLEAIKLEKDRIETERLEIMRVEEERIELERLEILRIKNEKIEVARLEAIRVGKKRVELARLEALRVEEEKVEAERLETLRIETERIAAVKLEAIRVEEKRIELERLEVIRIEEERIELERLESLRIEKEKIEIARIEAIRVEKERIEVERLEGIRVEEGRIELERLEILRIKNERIELERLEAIRLKGERAQTDRSEKIRVEEERIEAERLETLRIESQRIELARLEAIRVEGKRIEISRLEVIRVEQERIELERLETLRMEALERERLDRAELEIIEQEWAEALEIERLEILEAERLEMKRLEILEMKRLESERVDIERQIIEDLQKEQEETARSLALQKIQQDRISSTSTIPFPSSSFTLPEDWPTSNSQHLMAADIADNAISDLLNSIDSSNGTLPTTAESGTRTRPLLPLADSLFIAERAVSDLRSTDQINFSFESKNRISGIFETYSEICEMVEDIRRRPLPFTRPSSRPNSRRSTFSRSISTTTIGGGLPGTPRKREKSTSGIPTPISRPTTPYRNLDSTISTSRSHKYSLSRSVSGLSSAAIESGTRRTVSASLNLRSSTSRLNRNSPVDSNRSESRAVDRVVDRIVMALSIQEVYINPADNTSDLSGLYWIGQTEPKLYFIRILRSEIAMVRVGGGWTELGSFLKTHFGTVSVDISPSNSIQSSLESSPSALSLSQRSYSFSSNSVIAESPVRKRTFVASNNGTPRWRP